MRFVFLGVFVSLGASSAVSFSAEPLSAQVDIAVKDLRGTSHRIPDSSHVAHVVVFSRTDCPIANAYQPSLQALAKEFASQSVAFYLVHVDPQVTEPMAAKHATDYGISFPVVVDSDYRLARICNAKVTPEAFVIDAAGKVCYRGRIDDRYPELGKKRPQPTREDLKIALSELLAGKPISQPTTTSIGCLIRQ